MNYTEIEKEELKQSFKKLSDNIQESYNHFDKILRENTIALNECGMLSYVQDIKASCNKVLNNIPE